jgi:hypothetical protein
MGPYWGAWFKERDLLVGSNDVANGQGFHREKNNFASLGPLEKIFSGCWKFSRFLSSIEMSFSM